MSLDETEFCLQCEAKKNDYNFGWWERIDDTNSASKWFFICQTCYAGWRNSQKEHKENYFKKLSALKEKYGYR